VAADLHIHTRYSDGLDSPAHIVCLAIERGLSAIAICDHDCVGGLPEAFAAAEQRVQIITGVEINAEENGTEVHVLGYAFPLSAGGLEELTAWLQESRLERLDKFIHRLAQHGMQVRAEEVLSLAGPGAVGRPHLAKVLADKGFAGSVKEAFHHFLSPGRATYVPRERVPPARAIEIVHSVGGVAVLAHPFHGLDLGRIRGIVDLGIEGLEVGHPEHSPKETGLLRRLARNWGLLTTGGSDYHGGMMEEGAEIGGVTCSDDEVAALLARASRL